MNQTVNDAPSPKPVSPFTLVNVVLRARRSILLLPLISALVAGAVGYYGKEYIAHTRLIPEMGGASGGNLAGLAATFGFSLGGAAGDSPEFYADLLTGEDLLRSAVLSEYRFAVRTESSDSLHGTLLDLWRIEGATESERLNIAVERLRDDISVGVSSKSRILTLGVTTQWAGLSEVLAARLLELLDEFNREKRQTSASKEKAFAAREMRLAEESLRSAEERLASFHAQNRGYTSSPSLSLQADRLRRRVSSQQAVYDALEKAYRQASIEVERNTPSFSVIDRPEGTARKTRSTLMSAVMGGAMGLFLAIGLAFLGRFWASQREEHKEELGETTELLRSWIPFLGRR